MKIKHGFTTKKKKKVKVTIYYKCDTSHSLTMVYL